MSTKTRFEKEAKVIQKWSIDSEEGFCTGFWNLSHKQQSFSGQSPRWSFSIKVCYSGVQTILLLWLL